jgi:hypothetical protein
MLFEAVPRTVGEQARRGLQGLVQALHHRRDLAGCRAEPVGEDRAADPDPLARQDLRCRYSGK